MGSTIPTPSEMLALAFSGSENFVSAAEEREQERPHTFLSLAPTTSSSYPTTPVVKSPAAKSPEQVAVSNDKAAVTEAALSEALATPVVPAEKTRRSSSLSSDGSLMQKKRFLKLGPVHFGAGTGDWSEDVVE